MTPSQGIVINPLPHITVSGGVDSINISAVDNAVSKEVSAAVSVPMGFGTVQNDIPSTRLRQNVGTYKDGPAIIRQLPINGESYDLAFNSHIISAWEHPVPAVAN